MLRMLGDTFFHGGWWIGGIVWIRNSRRGSINSFKGRLDKVRKTMMGFSNWNSSQSPRPHGDGTPWGHTRWVTRWVTSPRYRCEALQWVCLFVGLFARITRKPRGSGTSPNYLRMLPTAVALSFADGIAICYVLPVLLPHNWNTACRRRRTSVTNIYDGKR